MSEQGSKETFMTNAEECMLAVDMAPLSKPAMFRINYDLNCARSDVFLVRVRRTLKDYVVGVKDDTMSRFKNQKPRDVLGIMEYFANRSKIVRVQ